MKQTITAAEYRAGQGKAQGGASLQALGRMKDGWRKRRNGALMGK